MDACGVSNEGIVTRHIPARALEASVDCYLRLPWPAIAPPCGHFLDGSQGLDKDDEPSTGQCDVLHEVLQLIGRCGRVARPEIVEQQRSRKRVERQDHGRRRSPAPYEQRE